MNSSLNSNPNPNVDSDKSIDTSISLTEEMPRQEELQPCPSNDTEADLPAEEKGSPENSCNQEPQATDPFKLYPMRLEKFMSFYRTLVVAAFAGITAAVIVAIYESLLYGALIGIGSIFIYIFFASNEIFEKLGLAYKTTAGSLEIKYCRKKYGDVFFVPSKILWYDVEKIGDEAFNSVKNEGLTEIYIPKSIKSFGKDVFCGCADLIAIRFEGSEEEWQAIENVVEAVPDGVELTYNSEFPQSLTENKNQQNKTQTKTEARDTDKK